MRAGDFFGRLAGGEDVYLADVPIAIHFPWLFDEIQVPAYFLHDFSHRTRRKLSIMHDTPALFVSAAGTASSLHVDQMCSNFWMFLAEGTKRWTTFHPEDAPLLSPCWDDEEQINRFAPLAELEAETGVDIGAAESRGAARLHEARRLDFELRAGEVLYIPHNTPHEVANLTPTCAVSANYIDQTNVEAALAQGAAKLARRPAGSARHANLHAIMAALDEVEWPVLADDLGASSGGAGGGMASEAVSGWVSAVEAAVPAALSTGWGDDQPSPVGLFAAHERLRGSRPVTICAP